MLELYQQCTTQKHVIKPLSAGTLSCAGWCLPSLRKRPPLARWQITEGTVSRHTLSCGQLSSTSISRIVHGRGSRSQPSSALLRSTLQ